MIRLTLKSLAANKIRFALTTLGITLAVSFVVAAFVLGDGLRRSFSEVSEEATAGVDLEVRNVAEFGDVPPLPVTAVDAVGGVPGVATAAAQIEAPVNAVRPVKPDGSMITTNGPPQLAFGWIADEALSPFRLVDGAAPDVGEFTMDVDAADKHGFVVGDTYEVVVPDGRVALTLSGTTSFGSDNATLGAVLMQMDSDQSPELFGMDGISSVAVRVDDGSDVDSIRAAITAAMPGAEVVDHDTVLDETTSEFTDEIDLVGNILLGFGGVALFVSAFLIYNTFAIVMGQRIRELALLRSLGAGAAQIRRSVLGEAMILGALASVAGIAGGIVVAKGIEALFGVMGFDLVDYPLILAPRTLIASAVIGVGVTVLAAAGPARRAATVPPVAVIVGGSEATAASTRRRRSSGLALIAVGMVAAAAGLAGVGPPLVTALGLLSGAVAVFLGITSLSQLAVGAVTAVLGWPMRLVAGVTGRLAQRNATRNARRTASTAAALMIGLTVVTMGLVVGATVKATIGSTFERAARAEYYLTDDLDEVAFPAALADELRSSPIIDAATGFTPIDVKLDGAVTSVVGFEFDEIAALIDLDVREGSWDAEGTRRAMVSAEEAGATGIGVGDVLRVEAADGTSAEATVVGVFQDRAVIGEDYVLDTAVLGELGVPATPEWLAVSVIDGAPAAEVEALVDQLAERFPHASVETADEFRERIEATIDKVLAMVNVMVGLAIVIALLGIANTLALSVFERTRELGLVRAVGMSRRQLRRMVKLEAALVALFGATLGVGLGVAFGSGVVTILPSSIAAGVTIPVLPIAAVVLVAAAAAVVAAWLPARRAGRLNVLEAIAL
jgi:putative ABC transport system permease protein